MVGKKRRAFLRKRHARLTMAEAGAALAAAALIAVLSVMAFRGGPTAEPAAALTEQDELKDVPAQTAPAVALVGTQVESVRLAATGANTTVLFIAGVSAVALGATIELRASRRRA